MHSNRGFGLIELLVVVAILAVLAGVGLFMLNPAETNKEARDAKRLEDFRNIRQVIEFRRGESSNILCGEGSAPCSGNSFSTDPNFRKTDGSGWLKMPFNDLVFAIMPVLPIDPVNDARLNYIYYSDGYDYELNVRLESWKHREKMVNDGGDNPEVYEVGTRFDLL